MEFIDGPTMDQLIEQQGSTRGLPVEVALQLLDQIARAVDAAHRAGVTHRDLKPENVMVGQTADGDPWVTAPRVTFP